MEKLTEKKIRDLVDKFALLRTKEGSDAFDMEWNALMGEIPFEERKDAGRILREEMGLRRVRFLNDGIKPQLCELSGIINMSYIAREFFHKDKSWLSQRLNGNIVNGKVASFSDAELCIFRSALEDIKNRLSETISNI